MGQNVPMSPIMQGKDVGCNVPTFYSKDDPKLCNWVVWCRQFNLLKTGEKLQLPGVNLAKLELVGLYDLGDIDIDVTDGWSEMFETLVWFNKAKTGQCNVPYGFKENPKLSLRVCRKGIVLCRTSCLSAENRSIQQRKLVLHICLKKKISHP